MIDVEVVLPHRPGTLAALGRALGDAGISLEGGGAFLAGDGGVAHFLIATTDLLSAQTALTAAGLELVAAREPVLLRLRQEVPGQLGAVCGALADAGVQIEAQYSDHGGRLVLLVDRPDDARRVTAGWADT